MKRRREYEPEKNIILVYWKETGDVPPKIVFMAGYNTVDTARDWLKERAVPEFMRLKNKFGKTVPSVDQMSLAYYSYPDDRYDETTAKFEGCFTIVRIQESDYYPFSTRGARTEIRQKFCRVTK